MAIDSVLSSLEAGIAEGRKDALARQQLEQQQKQAAQSQANNDRTYQLSVLNSMIGLQQSMPKPVNPLVAQAQTLVEQFGGPGNLAKVFRGEVPAPEGFDVDNAGFIVNGAAKVDDSFAFLGQAYDPTPTGQARRDLNRQATLFGVPKEDLIRLSATGDIEGLKKINPNITDSEGSSLLHMATIGYGTEGQLYSKSAEIRALRSPAAADFTKKLTDLRKTLASRSDVEGFGDITEEVDAAVADFRKKNPEIAFNEKLPGQLQGLVDSIGSLADDRKRAIIEKERSEGKAATLAVEIANARAWYMFDDARFKDAAEAKYGISKDEFRKSLKNETPHTSEQALRISGMLVDFNGLTPEQEGAMSSALTGGDRIPLSSQFTGATALREGREVGASVGVDAVVGEKVDGGVPIAKLDAAESGLASQNGAMMTGARNQVLWAMRDTRAIRSSGRADLAKTALRRYAALRDVVTGGDGPLSKTSPVWRAEALYAAEAKLNAMKEKPKTQAELMKVLGEATMSARSTFSGRIADDLNIMDFLVNEYSGEIEDLPDKE